MKDEIIEKLRREVSRTTFDEPQAVYILSRIRKYLELNELKEKFPYLNFYCNWALHARIDRRLPEPVEKMLKDYLEQTDERRLWDFDYLRSELCQFLSDCELPKRMTENNDIFEVFKRTVFEIYTDTPVQFNLGQFKITLTAYKSENQRKLRWGIS